jgi:transmembrane sensor
MSENEQLELRGLKLGWNEQRTERLFATVQSRIERRKLAGRAALASAALLSVLCLLLVGLRYRAQQGFAPIAHSDAAGSLRLADGSLVRFNANSADLRVAEQTATRVLVEQAHGSARYAVAPNAARSFEVHAGSVTVTVVGTEFVVERRGERAWVDVTRGKVRVSWGPDFATRTLLAAGESGFFPPAVALDSATAGGASTPQVDASDAGLGEADAPARAQQVSQVYRSHVASRNYREAYAVLARNPSLAGDTVKDLLVAADVARLSNHPAEAVPYLQRILRDHARDERAPMAAFTLGRTLSGLGRTREAMNLFARVRSQWPNSPLGEDALLRQAEAASKLGDSASLARIAAQYDRDYPNGRRRAEVRRYAQLE